MCYLCTVKIKVCALLYQSNRFIKIFLNLDYGKLFITQYFFRLLKKKMVATTIICIESCCTSSIITVELVFSNTTVAKQFDSRPVKISLPNRPNEQNYKAAVFIYLFLYYLTFYFIFPFGRKAHVHAVQ